MSLGDDALWSPAAALIRGAIAARGPITFARFMELALYAPGIGYYEAPAAQGFCRDYVTSPELHPSFGVLLCGQLDEMWRRLGRPGEFWLIEGGPGTGVFAADALATAEEAFPEFARALRVGVIERSAQLRDVQRATLAQWIGRVSWLEAESATPLGPGCLLANELLDAFPVHRVVMREAGLREAYVAASGAGFIEVEDELSTLKLEEQIEAGGGQLRVGDRGEVNLDGPRWVISAAALIERGYVLLLDYGEPAGTLYGERHPRGTVRCYWRHMMNEEPYRRVGAQDITAHVDLSAVTRAGEASGLALLGATHQTRLLERLGLAAIRHRITDEISSRAEQRAHLAALELLSDPRHLGRVSALLMGKGVPGAPLAGFLEASTLAPPRIGRVLDLRIQDPVGLAESLH